jgi:hypothetical protein
MADLSYGDVRAQPPPTTRGFPLDETVALLRVEVRRVRSLPVSTLRSGARLCCALRIGSGPHHQQVAAASSSSSSSSSSCSRGDTRSIKPASSEPAMLEVDEAVGIDSRPRPRAPSTSLACTSSGGSHTWLCTPHAKLVCCLSCLACYRVHSLPHPRSLSAQSHIHIHSFSLISLSFSPTHTHTLSLCLSLSPTHRSLVLSQPSLC